MASVSSTQSKDSYDADRIQQENNERAREKNNRDSEKEIATAKEEYNARLKTLKDEANEDIRRLKEKTYNSQGRQLTQMEREHLQETKRLQNSHQAELENEQRSREGLEKNYQARLHSAEAKVDNKDAGLSRENQEQMWIERQRLAQGYHDLETKSELTQNQLEHAQKNQGEHMYRDHVSQIDTLQKHHEDQYKAQQYALQDEKFRVKEDLEMKQRDQNREWTYKINDTHREYQKKLQDQQDFHQQQLGEMKAEFDKKLQDHDRKANILLSDRIKAYETQLKQQEVSFKEKERFLTEQNEEELDRLKRTNALISQKKS